MSNYYNPQNGRKWGSNTPVSMPEPLRSDQKVYVDMGGFGFTVFGIAHNFQESDREAYLPPLAPPDYPAFGDGS